MHRILTVTVVGLAAAASVWIFLSVDSRSHSVSDTLYGAAVPIGLAWLIALAVVFVLRRTMTGP